MVEVKTIQPQELEGLHKDSTYNAIKNNFRKSAAQFSNFDSGHKMRHVVVLFSDGITRGDIHSVLTGQFDSTNPIPFLSLKEMLSGNHKEQFDVVVWFKTISLKTPSFILFRDERLKINFSEN